MATTGMNCLASGGGVTNITQDVSPSSEAASKNYTLTVGKVYLLFIHSWYSDLVSPTRFDNTTFTGATYEKIGNSDAYTSTRAPGTFFKIVPTQTNVTVTPPYNAMYNLFSFE